MAQRESLSHLLRRATFGPTAEEIDAAERAGLSATVQRLVRPASPEVVTPPHLGDDPRLAFPKDPQARQQVRQHRREQVRALTQWWLERMVSARDQFAEKLVFFWHGHWATSARKVNSAHLMLAQQQNFRRFGQGDFAVLVQAMLRDPALLLWLDGQRNTVKAPNENLARELMELFTLGIGNYTEADVKEAARALTGWTLDRTTGRARFEPGRFDAGDKRVLGRSGRFDADGLAEVLLAQPASARFVASRLWFRFASGQPIPPATLERLVSAYGPRRDVAALVTAMFTDPGFEATRGHLAKQPVELVIGALRQLGVAPSQPVATALAALGQVPLRPPSVAGWPSGTAWLTTFSAQTRLRLGQSLAAAAPGQVIDRIAAAPARERPEITGRLLAVDAWTERTRAALLDAAKDPRRLLALSLASPEYSVQ